MNKQATVPFSVEVTSGPTPLVEAEHYEVYFSRRALARLKALLGRRGLEDLLATDIEEGNAYFREMVSRSEGKWKPATTELTARGISSAQFTAWFHDESANEPVMLAAQPEHFVIAGSADALDVVENMGPYVCSYKMHFTGEDAAVGDLLADYPTRMVGHGKLADGTVVIHALHQFRDTAAGFDAHLSIFFPHACPEAEIIEQHRRHLAVEFSNWITDAAASAAN